jgi:hypothetical protein
VAVVDASGEVLAATCQWGGADPEVIGELTPGTPAAFEAAFGTSGVVELLEDYGFTPHPGARAAVQGDRLGAAEER